MSDHPSKTPLNIPQLLDMKRRMALPPQGKEARMSCVERILARELDRVEAEKAGVSES